MVSMSKAKIESRPLPKRFYVAVEVQQNDAAFLVLLDGKPIRTPARNILQSPVRALADAMAEEWLSQVDVIDTDSMPLTRLTSLAMDRIAADRVALLHDLSGYGATDLVCYRTPRSSGNPIGADMEKLRACQDAAFDPILQWAASEYCIALEVTDTVMPIAQDAASLSALAAQFAAANDAELAALAMLVPILGSAVLALAVWRKRLTIEEALASARLEEDFQSEHWGADPDSVQAWANKCRDAQASAFFLDMQVAHKSA